MRPTGPAPVQLEAQQELPLLLVDGLVVQHGAAVAHEHHAVAVLWHAAHGVPAQVQALQRGHGPQHGLQRLQAVDGVALQVQAAQARQHEELVRRGRVDAAADGGQHAQAARDGGDAGGRELDAQARRQALVGDVQLLKVGAGVQAGDELQCMRPRAGRGVWGGSPSWAQQAGAAGPARRMV